MVLRNTMNSGSTLIMAGRRHLAAVLAAALLGCPGYAASAAAGRGDRADEAVLIARDAFRTGNSLMLSRVAANARGHVLQPYVEFWQVRMRLEERSAAEVLDFLSRHEGSYLAERLRADWLRVLGKKGDWETFRGERQRLVNEDSDIACMGLLERYRSGDTSVLAELRPVWLTPKELPEGCGALAEQQLRDGAYGVPQVWERFRVLAAAGQMPSARRVLTMLPVKEQPATALIERIVAAPDKYLLQLSDSATTRTAREMVILAMMRLSRSDPQAAAARWNDSLRASFSAEDQSYVWGQIAWWGARRHLPEAVGWFAQAAYAQLGDDQLAWRARIALRNSAWPEVLGAVDQMSPQARRDSTWVYWRGRALRETGKTAEARAHFTAIAAEHSFYGLLAAEELGQNLVLPPRAPQPTSVELTQALAVPGLQRALALFRLDLRTEAVREWNWSLRGMDDRQLIAASEIAKRNELWDRAINTADRTVAQHDFSLRYLAPYHQVLAGRARAQDLEEHWVLGLVRQESRFISNAKSSAGAAGLMQLMPATARWVANKMGMKDFQWTNVTAIDVNAALGSYYLKTVLNDLEGSPVLASAAYNAGPGRARRWQDAKPIEGAIYAESIPFDETRDYVKKVMANALFYAAVHGGNPRSLRERLGIIGARAGTRSSDIP